MLQVSQMLYLNNQDISQLLTSKHCIDALEEAFGALASNEAVSRPRTDVWVPCGRPDAFVDLLTGRAKGRTSPRQITFFHNLGLLGFQFAAVAAKAYKLAQEQRLGHEIFTQPYLQDIRD